MSQVEQQLMERLEVYRGLCEPTIKEQAWDSLKRFAIRHSLNLDELTRKNIDTSTLSDYELRNIFY